MALQTYPLSKIRAVCQLKPTDLREDMHPLHPRELHVSEPIAKILKSQLVIDEFLIRPIRPVAFVVPEVVDRLCHRPMIRFKPHQPAGQQKIGGDNVPGAVAWAVPEGAFLVGVCEVFVLQQREREDVISDLWGGRVLKSGDCDWGLHEARFSGVGRVSMGSFLEVWVSICWILGRWVRPWVLGLGV